MGIALPNGVEDGVHQLVKVALSSMVALFGTYQIAANGVAQSIWSVASLVASTMGPVFITVIGLLLFFDSLGINSGIEVLDMHMEKLMVYCAMVFAVVLELIQMRYSSNLAKWKEERKTEQLNS